jgi:hypothetical protein
MSHAPHVTFDPLRLCAFAPLREHLLSQRKISRKGARRKGKLKEL